jgi:hypothetical protein
MQIADVMKAKNFQKLGPFVFTSAERAKEWVMAKWKHVFIKEANDENSLPFHEYFDQYVDEDTEKWPDDFDFAALLDSGPDYRTPYGKRFTTQFGEKLMSYTIHQTQTDPDVPPERRWYDPQVGEADQAKLTAVFVNS